MVNCVINFIRSVNDYYVFKLSFQLQSCILQLLFLLTATNNSSGQF